MKRNLPLLGIVIGITVPALGMLAWNQFNWLEELQVRDKARIEARMVDAAQTLSKRVKEELYYLPSVFRIRGTTDRDIGAVLGERYAFWNYYSAAPELLTDLYVIDGADGSAQRWNGVSLEPCDLPKNFAAPGSAPDQRTFFNSSIIDSETQAFLVLPVDLGKNRNSYVLCALDKAVLNAVLIPKLAEETLGEADSYAFRVIDSLSSSVLWTSSDTSDDPVFRRVDLDFPLLGHIELPAFEQGPAIRLQRVEGDYVQVFSIIKQRVKIDDSIPPGDVPPQLFMNLRLQIANRDASLAALSRRATVQNAVLSFGVVFLLVAVMIALVEANRRSNRLAKSQQEFIATVTHELKTPLAVISSAAQNLTDGLIRDQRKAEQYGTMIRKEASRLGASIEHFLLYSNTNSVTRTKPERIAVADLVQSALRFTEEERQLNGFRTEIILPEEEAWVEGDRIALESVFRNLAQNVLRHAGEGKYIGVIVSVAEKKRRNRAETVTVKVRDRGPGISAKEQKTIFEPFVRGRRAVNNQIPGNGIGLNLVKRIVTLHGGTIELESKPPAGSTFIVNLPAAPKVSETCTSGEEE